MHDAQTILRAAEALLSASKALDPIADNGDWVGGLALCLRGVILDGADHLSKLGSAMVDGDEGGAS